MYPSISQCEVCAQESELIALAQRLQAARAARSAKENSALEQAKAELSASAARERQLQSELEAAKAEIARLSQLLESRGAAVAVPPPESALTAPVTTPSAPPVDVKPPEASVKSAGAVVIGSNVGIGANVIVAGSMAPTPSNNTPAIPSGYEACDIEPQTSVHEAPPVVSPSAPPVAVSAYDAADMGPPASAHNINAIIAQQSVANSGAGGSGYEAIDVEPDRPVVAVPPRDTALAAGYDSLDVDVAVIPSSATLLPPLSSSGNKYSYYDPTSDFASSTAATPFEPTALAADVRPSANILDDPSSVPAAAAAAASGIRAWNDEFQLTFELPQNTLPQKLKRAAELNRISRAFTESATALAQTIVRELGKPASAQTIPPVDVGGIAGGGASEGVLAALLGHCCGV